MRISSRADLETIRQDLESWKNEVPADGLRFHKSRIELLAIIKQRLDGWWGSFSLRFSDETRRLCERVDVLKQSRSKLRELLLTRANALTKIEGLRAKSRALKQKAIRDKVADHGNRWEGDLVRFGRSVETIHEVNAEAYQLDDLDKAIDREREAVDLFGSADGLAAENSSLLEHLDRQILINNLSPIVDEFIRVGATPEVVAQLKGLVASANEKKQKEMDHSLTVPEPADSDAIFYLRAEVEHWAELVSADWSMVERSLNTNNAGELEDLRQSFRQKAENIRQQDLARIRARARFLTDACGPIPRLESDISALETIQPVDFRDFERFREKQSKVHKLLVATAKTEPQRLSEALHSKLGNLRSQLASLRQSVRSLAAETAAAEIEIMTYRLVETRTEPEAILDALSECGGSEERLNLLHARSASGVAELARSVSRMDVRLQQIREFYLSERLTLPVDWDATAAGLDSIRSPSHEQLLDQYHSALEGLSRRLATYEEALREYTARSLTVINEQTNAAVKVLRSFNAPIPDSADLFQSPLPEEIEKLKRTVKSANEYQSSIRELLANAIQAIGKETSAQTTQLRDAIQQGVIRDPNVAKDLLEERERLEAAPSSDAAETLQNFMKWRSRAEGVLAVLKRYELAVKAKQKFLLKRLINNFTYEAWNVYHPAYVERARALVEGVPDGPGEASERLRQLAVAESMISMLEADARRRISDDVMCDRQAVEMLQKSKANGDLRREIQAVLSELDNSRHETPPYALRRKLSQIRDRSEDR